LRILTGRPEEQRVRDALVAAYGEPITVSEDYNVFGDGSGRLRKDKSKVLFCRRSWRRRRPRKVTNKDATE